MGLDSSNNSTKSNNDELMPTQTEGYKVSEKKTLQEFTEMDKEDESLTKWKQSLGLNAKATGPVDDPRKVVVLELAMLVEDRDDVKMDLSTEDSLKQVKSTVTTLKEGIEYRLRIRFRVQHEVVSGLKYLHAVKRKGTPITVSKSEEMLGSYGPSETVYEKIFPPEKVPSGMLSRGTYNVKSRFIDDDKTKHLEWEWSFEIKKEWKQ